ncbi:hypothetical protein GEMRC1_008070 [Eukaryota sp. GEM-RC1]
MITLSVRPHTGRAGLVSDNIYPGFSATHMGFGKFYSAPAIIFLFFNVVRDFKPQLRYPQEGTSRIQNVFSTICANICQRFILFTFFVVALLYRFSFRFSVWHYERDVCYETQFTLNVIFLSLTTALALLFVIYDVTIGFKKRNEGQSSVEVS